MVFHPYCACMRFCCCSCCCFLKIWYGIGRLWVCKTRLELGLESLKGQDERKTRGPLFVSRCTASVPLAVISSACLHLTRIISAPFRRISYCTADKMHDKVFAYIAQSQRNETLECHAFLCSKKKVVSLVFFCLFFLSFTSSWLTWIHNRVSLEG